MLTKIALAAALIIAPLSAALAKDHGGKASRHVRAQTSYGYVQPSPYADWGNSYAPIGPTGPAQPFKSWSDQQRWFDYQKDLGG
jgi:hypothetical protein